MTRARGGGYRARNDSTIWHIIPSASDMTVASPASTPASSGLYRNVPVRRGQPVQLERGRRPVPLPGTGRARRACARRVAGARPRRAPRDPLRPAGRRACRGRLRRRCRPRTGRRRPARWREPRHGSVCRARHTARSRVAVLVARSVGRRAPRPRLAPGRSSAAPVDEQTQILADLASPKSDLPAAEPHKPVSRHLAARDARLPGRHRNLRELREPLIGG